MLLHSPQVPSVLRLLANDVRWQLLQALVYGDHRVQELTQLLDKPQNLVSYHLRKLREADLVTERRSSADSRDVYYHLDLGRLQDRYVGLGKALHPAIAANPSVTAPEVRMRTPTRILFLCTHNSARSQMAEAILRVRSWLPIEVYSAGNVPTAIHPLAVRTMQEIGIDMSQQRTKHVDEFAGYGFELVITVCDRMREVCPTYPNDPQQIHWSIGDPADVQGSDEDRYQAFRKTAVELATRIHYLLLTMDVQLKEAQDG